MHPLRRPALFRKPFPSCPPLFGGGLRLFRLPLFPERTASVMSSGFPSLTQQLKRRKTASSWAIETATPSSPLRSALSIVATVNSSCVRRSWMSQSFCAPRCESIPASFCWLAVSKRRSATRTRNRRRSPDARREPFDFIGQKYSIRRRWTQGGAWNGRIPPRGGIRRKVR